MNEIVDQGRSMTWHSEYPSSLTVLPSSPQQTASQGYKLQKIAKSLRD